MSWLLAGFLEESYLHRYFLSLSLRLQMESANGNSNEARKSSSCRRIRTFMFFQILTSISSRNIGFWSSIISHYGSLLGLQSQHFNIIKLNLVQIKLLTQSTRPTKCVNSQTAITASVRVDPPLLPHCAYAGTGREQIIEDSAAQKFCAIAPGSTEDWDVREVMEASESCCSVDSKIRKDCLSIATRNTLPQMT